VRIGKRWWAGGEEVGGKLCVEAITVILPVPSAQSLTNEKRFGCQFRLFHLSIILIYFSCIVYCVCFLLVYEEWPEKFDFRKAADGREVEAGNPISLRQMYRIIRNNNMK